MVKEEGGRKKENEEMGERERDAPKNLRKIFFLIPKYAATTI